MQHVAAPVNHHIHVVMDACVLRDIYAVDGFQGLVSDCFGVWGLMQAGDGDGLMQAGQNAHLSALLMS